MKPDERNYEMSGMRNGWWKKDNRTEGTVSPFILGRLNGTNDQGTEVFMDSL